MFLVGGGSRIPLAASLLHRALRIAPTVLDHPELVVAEGSQHTPDPTPDKFAPNRPAPTRPPTGGLMPPTAAPSMRAMPPTPPATALPAEPPVGSVGAVGAVGPPPAAASAAVPAAPPEPRPRRGRVSYPHLAGAVTSTAITVACFILAITVHVAGFVAAGIAAALVTIALFGRAFVHPADR